MSNPDQIQAAVAFALHEDLDMMTACPELTDMPVEKLEKYVENYIIDLQENINCSIQLFGKKLLAAEDAKGLRKLLMVRGVKCPPEHLLKVCEGIIRNMKIRSKFLGFSPYPGGPQPCLAGAASLATSDKIFGGISWWYCHITI